MAPDRCLHGLRGMVHAEFLGDLESQSLDKIPIFAIVLHVYGI